MLYVPGVPTGIPMAGLPPNFCVQAAVFVVDDTESDDSDAAIGNGDCKTLSDQCTLRAAPPTEATQLLTPKSSRKLHGSWCEDTFFPRFPFALHLRPNRFFFWIRNSR